SRTPLLFTRSTRLEDRFLFFVRATPRLVRAPRSTRSSRSVGHIRADESSNSSNFAIVRASRASSSLALFPNRSNSSAVFVDEHEPHNVVVRDEHRGRGAGSFPGALRDCKSLSAPDSLEIGSPCTTNATRDTPGMSSTRYGRPVAPPHLAVRDLSSRTQPPHVPPLPRSTRLAADFVRRPRHPNAPSRLSSLFSISTPLRARPALTLWIIGLLIATSRSTRSIRCASPLCCAALRAALRFANRLDPLKELQPLPPSPLRSTPPPRARVHKPNEQTTKPASDDVTTHPGTAFGMRRDKSPSWNPALQRVWLAQGARDANSQGESRRFWRLAARLQMRRFTESNDARGLPYITCIKYMARVDFLNIH
ncbi:hypothetical protein B0H12DRAFT_1079120, partial [Mycena haematopus]